MDTIDGNANINILEEKRKPTILKIFSNRLFILIVLIPFLLSVIYYSFIASDIYISESTFIVKSVATPNIASSAGAFSNLMQATGIVKTNDDATYVQNYILSKDAVKELYDRLSIKKIFSDKKIDFIKRFPSLDWDESFEAFHRYYQKRIVDVHSDSSTGVITLTVKAFSPADAFLINQILLQRSEELVNRLNERARNDMLEFAMKEVRKSEERAKLAAAELAKYRNENNIIDPEKQSSINIQQIAKLQEQLISINSQLIHLKTFTPQNPQIASLQKQAELLKNEIQIETEKVAGSEDSLAKKSVKYQLLVLEKEFADRHFASVMATLEQARTEVLRKQAYLERIAGPSKPDAPREPRRILYIFVTLILCLIIWGIVSLLIAGVKEHTY